MNHFILTIFLSVIILLPATPANAGGSRTPSAPGSATVTILVSQYTYPMSISANGQHIVGVPFGGGSGYYWSAGTGLITISGDISAVSDGGKGTGTWYNPGVQYNGNNVACAGTWEPSTNQWTFLGMNPGSMTIFATDYNSGWDITSDGNTVVGMQYYPGYVFHAFKWNSTSGYTDLGSGVGEGSRASGISANGLVTYGWAQVPAAGRTPVIWYNGQVIYVNNTQWGEGFGASTTGNYVAGTVGNNGFLWSPSSTITFSNTLTSGAINPSTVLNDGTVMGYTDGTVPTPNNRRAFVRHLNGSLTTFNDYAESRGMSDAQLWTFYSINDVSADGNRFIGAGKNPSNQQVTFLIEFTSDAPVFTATPSSLEFGTVPSGSQSPFRELGFTNSGTGTLVLNGVALAGSDASQFVLQDANTYPLNVPAGDTAWVTVAFAPTSTGSKTASVSVTMPAGPQSVPVHGTGDFPSGVSGLAGGDLRLFPNPATDQVTVCGLRGSETIRVLDIAGRVVLTTTAASGTQSVDLSGFAPSVYFVRVEASGGESRLLRLVVSR